MKINKLIIIIICACLLPFIDSCDSDDFSGTDNYVTSFVLQKDGVDYAATIIGDDINVTVPTNVSLSGATVTCQMSEYASVSPDPKTITDWDNAQEFTVTSKNNSSRTYKYTVNKSDISEKGVVMLRTQTDVKAFASKNIAVLDGSLMIGENNSTDNNDSIKDLSALSSLKQISGSLIINNSFAGNSLTGLNNLTSVANLYIGTTSSTLTIPDSLDINFPMLASAGEININYNKAKNISFPKLDNVYTLFVKSNSMKSISLDVLKQVYGDLTIGGTSPYLTTLAIKSLAAINGSLSITNLPKVTKVDFEALKIVGNNMGISSLQSLETLNTSVENVGGQLSLNSLNKYTDVSFGKLKAVGSLYYRGDYSNRPATSFDFSVLESVSNNIDVDYTSLTTLNFPALKSIGGNFKLQDSQDLATLTMPKLTSCPTIYISEIYKLTSLDLSGITNLNKLSLISPYVLTPLSLPKTVNEIELNGGSRAQTFPEIQGLETITGKLTLSNYNKLTTANVTHVKSIKEFEQLDGSETTLSFPALESIGFLNISLNKLTTFNAPLLKTAEKIDWEYFLNETKVDLNSLTTITGELKFWGASWQGGAENCKLTNINFFSSLKSIGSVNIKWCGSLTDFSGLRNALSSLSTTTWSVTGCKYNPTYQNMLDGKTSSARRVLRANRIRR